MIVPQRALVRPRVISPLTGETLLFEEEMRELLERGKKETVWIVGGPGSGKRTALAHLMAVLPDESIGLVERDDPDRLLSVLFRENPRDIPKGALVYRLASWHDDEVLEYVLAAHRERTISIMSRWSAAGDRDSLQGSPELCRLALDQFASDEEIATVGAALNAWIDSRLPDAEMRYLAAEWCLAILCGEPHRGAIARVRLEQLCDFPALLRVIQHAAALLLLAPRRIVFDLSRPVPCEYLSRPLAPELIEAAGSLVRTDAAARSRLAAILADGHQWQLHPTAAGLLHVADPAWRPERYVAGPIKWLELRRRIGPNLKGANLRGVTWAGIDLRRIDLSRAILTRADLTNAILDKANAQFVDFEYARFEGASLRRFMAPSARLTGARLANVNATEANFDLACAIEANFNGARLQYAAFIGADLERATFIAADMTGVSLTAAKIVDADFTRANLTGARLMCMPLRTAEFRQCCFHQAHLADADLEGMSLPGVDFRDADLKGALLTGSFMPGSDFRGAKLTNAGLAEIEWERADLRNADLRGATFHMGSSRSGLVDSTIASYGTRTGFYTDDYVDQDFKAPEEIRKANLRGADLRGAKIDGVDFYLVDLREARYDPGQERQFRANGAILESRVR